MIILSTMIFLKLFCYIFSQAFREVFEYLIEDFKTYKPLLSAIKHEYEMMLIHQREKIRELEPLKVLPSKFDNTAGYLYVLYISIKSLTKVPFFK